jgi:hypothetical protein
MKEHLTHPAVVGSAIGATLAVARGAAVVLESHRFKTHHAVELRPHAEKALRFLQESIGSIPEVWSEIHRTHHEWADVNGKVFLDLKRAIVAAESQDIPVPTEYAGLDPFVPTFTRDEVVELGRFAEEQVQTRLGDRYQAPTIDYSPEQLDHLLYNKDPRYYYPEMTKKGKGEGYTQDEIEGYMLIDPHSPALIGPDKKGQINGVRQTLIGSARRYAEIGKCYKRNPQLMSPDLQPKDPTRPWPSTKKKVIAAGAIATAATMAISKDYSLKGIVTAVVTTGAIGSLTVAGGSRIVNGPGHMGHSEEGEGDRDLLRAMTSPTYDIRINDDGTIGANGHSGPVQRLFRAVTYDELDQRNHHDFPGDAAYRRDTTGVNSSAPFGSVVEQAVEHAGITGIESGRGFEPNEYGLRPDEANVATRMVQTIRSERNPELLQRRASRHTT